MPRTSSSASSLAASTGNRSSSSSAGRSSAASASSSSPACSCRAVAPRRSPPRPSASRARSPTRDAAPVVVDLCCGAGAIGAAVVDAVGDVELTAADVDPAAVLAARRNLEPLGARVVAGDLFDALPRDLLGRVDVLAVNAPYVPTAEIAMMPPEARDHEARAALDGGADGLDVHRRVAASAREWLAPGGHLLIETSRRQAPTTAALVTAGGLAARVVRDDELAATIVIGRR